MYSFYRVTMGSADHAHSVSEEPTKIRQLCNTIHVYLKCARCGPVGCSVGVATDSPWCTT